jgi:tetratricopeptide (TPR) repeat protein
MEMNLAFFRWVSALVVSSAMGGVCVAQQLPPGTRSVDERAQGQATQEVSQEMREAETALEQGDYKGAEAKLKVLAATNPNDGRVMYDLGFAQERNGEDEEAAKSYAASIAAIPGFAEPRVALGLLDARSGRTQTAHAELLAVAKLDTASPQIRAKALRALVHLDERDHPDQAQQELFGALKLTAETPEDVLLGAELAERSGEAADAEAAYRRALKLLPGDIDATAGLAHVLQQQKKLAEADAVLGAALQEHPDDLRLVAQAVTLYAAEGKEAQAIPLLVHLREKDPKVDANAATTLLLARLYDVSGDNAAAEELYTQLVAAQPNDPTLLDALGSAQVKQGKDGPAELTLAKAFQMREAFHDDKAWAETAGHLAFAASKNSDPTMCLQALAARATVLPNSATSLFLQATAYDTLHQFKEAAKAYRAFLAMADGKFPDQEFQARHRLIALEPK